MRLIFHGKRLPKTNRGNFVHDRNIVENATKRITYNYSRDKQSYRMFKGIHFVEIVKDFGLGRASQNGKFVHNGNLRDVVLQHVAEESPDDNRANDVFLIHGFG